MKISRFSYKLIEDDEGDDAFEFYANGAPICEGVLHSLSAGFLSLGHEALPKISSLPNFSSAASEHLNFPEEAALIACCSCGFPDCGHKWAMENKVDGAVRLEVYGHFSQVAPDVFLFDAKNYSEEFTALFDLMESRGWWQRPEQNKTVDTDA